MKTEKEMIAFRQGYELATNIVNQTLKKAKTIDGCQDIADVLENLIDAMNEYEDCAVGRYVIQED